MSGFTPLTTVTVHKKTGASTTSTATLSLERRSDGSIAFTAADGNKVVVYSTANDAAKRLFETLDGLV